MLTNRKKVQLLRARTKGRNMSEDSGMIGVLNVAAAVNRSDMS